MCKSCCLYLPCFLGLQALVYCLTLPCIIVCPHHYILHIPCCVIEGANGDGMAVVTSLRSFDREQQKEYLIPIVIKDSGNPAMSGTSTLTVVIGDVNDNKMQPGSKDIFVYNYMVSYYSYIINYELCDMN